jgi:hypothetical protein
VKVTEKRIPGEARTRRPKWRRRRSSRFWDKNAALQFLAATRARAKR